MTSLCPDTAVPFYVERRDSGSQTGIKIGSAKSLKMSFFLPLWLCPLGSEEGRARALLACVTHHGR